ncbi:MAG: ATP-binding protein [Propionibacteriaceae bacterium]
MEAAYERRSVAVTSNIHPSGFDAIMPKTLATAAVDRLLHHAHVINHRRQLAAVGERLCPRRKARTIRRTKRRHPFVRQSVDTRLVS